VTCVVTPTAIQDLLNLTSTVAGNVIKVGVLVGGVVTDGTCTENVSIRGEKSRITLDGQGGAFGANGAVLIAASSDSATITVTGNEITITGFSSIQGGSQGISVSRGAFASIIKNTIEMNENSGISVSENGSARIGFINANDPPGAGNLIQNNGTSCTFTTTGQARCRGVQVSNSGSAVIVGNTITDNLGAGINVSRVSAATTGSNVIERNGQNGVEVSGNSAVRLGNTSGTTQFDLPNTTSAGNNNIGFGLRCSSNSLVQARLGSLNGSSGSTSFSSQCLNNLSQ
jgi:hypothetical protein